MAKGWDELIYRLPTEQGGMLRLFNNDIDGFQKLCENSGMNTIENVLVPSDALADLQHAMDLQSTGQRDPAFEKRISEQTEKIRQAILSEHGILIVAVDLIREGRAEA